VNFVLRNFATPQNQTLGFALCSADHNNKHLPKMEAPTPDITTPKELPSGTSHYFYFILFFVFSYNI
jgi:hypothetical protein